MSYPPRAPGEGRASPVRLIVVFVAVLAVAVMIAGGVALALDPGPKKADCPVPSNPCGGPPAQPTLPPVANATPTRPATPAPTLVRPSGTLVVSSATPATPRPTGPAASASPQPTPAASSGPVASGSPAPTVLATPPPPPPSPTPAPSGVPALNLPQPRPASAAAPLHSGRVWSSSELNFQLEYDDGLWLVQSEGSTSLVLSAGNGAVVVAIEGFSATGSPAQLVQEKLRDLGDQILGLTEETDPTRQLPGVPSVGHHPGVAAVQTGTLNTPQGPGANVDVVVLAATDSTITLRVTVVAVDRVREPAFAVADSLINNILWPSDRL